MIEIFVAAIFFAFFIGVPLMLTIWLLAYAAGAATVRIGYCRRCQYDLRGLGDRRCCPE